MDLVNELSSELALVFLVEKKHAEKLNTSDILALIGRVKDILQSLSAGESADRAILPAAVSARISH